MNKQKREQGPRHVTRAGRSVFDELFDPEEAAELKMRSALMIALKQWLAAAGLTQVQAAKVLGVTQARVSDLKRGKFNIFSLETLVRLAARAGLRPVLKLAA